MPRFNVSEGVDGEPPNVLVPGILRVVSARVTDARCLEEQTARAGIGAKREDVCSGNTERLAVSISVDVGEVEESTLLIIIEALYFICNDAF